MAFMVLRKIKCSRCGKLVQIARTQSRQKDGLITAYCYNESSHQRLKLRVMTSKNIQRTIRSNRLKSTVENENYNLRKLKCILCGTKLFFYKKGSYQRSGKIQGYCFNNKFHRLKFKIFSKLMNEPDFDELQEILIRHSDI